MNFLRWCNFQTNGVCLFSVGLSQKLYRYCCSEADAVVLKEMVALDALHREAG